MYDKQIWDTTSYVNPTRMNHIEQGIYDADLTSGGNINGNLQIDAQNGTTQAVGDSILRIGNSISQGSDKNSMGQIRIYSNGDKYSRIYTQPLTANRNIMLPDTSGTIAIDYSYKSGDSFTTNSETDCMYGYVNTQSQIRCYLPLFNSISVPDSSISVTVPNSIIIATITGKVTLQGVTVSRAKKAIGGLLVELNCTQNSNLVVTSPIMAGFIMTVTFS